MPMINVQMFEGRTTEQRRKLAKELTEGTCRALGCTPDAVQIIITDIKKAVSYTHLTLPTIYSV